MKKNEKTEKKRHVGKKEEKVNTVEGDNREKRMTAAKTVVIVIMYIPSNVKAINVSLAATTTIAGDGPATWTVVGWIFFLLLLVTR